jgi:uncharacterized integral membrane protein
VRTRKPVLMAPSDVPAPAPSGPEVVHGPTGVSGVPRTRVSRAWVRVVPAVVVLAITLLFVLQNLRSTRVSFVSFSGRLPLGAALLAAAALGGLLVFTLGAMRIVQLRRVIHRSHVSSRPGRPAGLS